MLLADLVRVSRQVAATASRTAKTATLAAALRRAAPEELEPLVAFLSGRMRQGRVGLGWATLEDALSPPAGASYSGDLFANPEDQGGEHHPVAVLDLDAMFDRVAGLKGAGSAGARQRAVGAVMARATAEEKDYIARLALGELRQGALAGLMEEAVAQASGISVLEIRRAAMLAGDLGLVALAVRTEGREGLARFSLTLFRPVLPMLAQPAADVAEALERLGEAGFEYKLDGARVQAHRHADQVRVFSRQGNDVTAAVPELVAAVRELPANELILDGEVVALDSAGAPLPFQITMRRFGRRLDVEALRAELPIRPFVFDLLRVDGRDLIDLPARDRVQRLEALAPALLVPRLVTARLSEAEAFYDRALAAGHEGVMAKSLNSPYQAGGRGNAWLKIKPAHTLDLVVLAAEWGHGRRQGWLSNLHLGARDPDSGEFVMLGKTFKGMTDAMLAWQTGRFRALERSREGHVVHLRPELVVEVAFSDVQESPHYPAGLALRFARVKRYREDKSPDDADTIETVRAIAAGQRRKSRT